MKLLLMLVFSVFLIGCQGTTTTSFGVGGVRVSQTHNPNSPKNKYDYQGKYTGSIPCSDCEAIDISVDIKNKNYADVEIKYIGKDEDKNISHSGKYRWNNKETAMIITINGEVNMFEVGNGTLTVLDSKGGQIDSSSQQSYVLKKVE